MSRSKSRKLQFRDQQKRNIEYQLEINSTPLKRKNFKDAAQKIIEDMSIPGTTALRLVDYMERKFNAKPHDVKRARILLQNQERFGKRAVS